MLGASHSMGLFVAMAHLPSSRQIQLSHVPHLDEHACTARIVVSTFKLFIAVVLWLLQTTLLKHLPCAPLAAMFCGTLLSPCSLHLLSSFIPPSHFSTASTSTSSTTSTSVTSDTTLSTTGDISTVITSNIKTTSDISTVITSNTKTPIDTSTISTSNINSSSTTTLPITTPSPTAASEIVTTTTDSHGIAATSTSFITVTAISGGTTGSSAESSANGGPEGFFHNTGAVAGVFTAVGIVVLVLIVALSTNAVRRHRNKVAVLVPYAQADDGISSDDLSTGCSGVTREKCAASATGIGALDPNNAGNMGSNSQTQHLCEVCKHTFNHAQNVLEWSSYGRHPAADYSEECNLHADVQLPLPGPIERLVPYRHDPTPSSPLWRAPSDSTIGSEEVDVLIGNNEVSPDNPTQSFSATPTIPNPDRTISVAAVSRVDHVPSYDDGFSVQTLSTMPPSYHTRRPGHEVEPWTLPPAYTTSHDGIVHSPSAIIPGQRVLRLHGPRSLLSVSSVFSNESIRDGREMAHVESMPPVVRCG
ncbi:hypothetical protein K466DRAFT_253515 [Polyporus arcularius HHB13444]|uniref:Uncharacterized protein n=1 Tax=Polyporus arcularius HHB13444 TaxID=1314778 RepID=A0A5C3P208_9APHY|nr:hypothetical protein K466DRAFT_253515 [Polyporus arcularius HHB13444]